ncbi:MAG: Crp/Fnr family transcriptional regulator [Hyphomicrobiales bacterium]|nr:Crp/Fnr family transcriptional regulator [Hyphomicrobiales bacterium]
MNKSGNGGKLADVGAVYLGSHPLFRGLDPGALERLARYMRHTSARKGQILFRKGDEGSFLMILVEGSVKIAAPTEDGREALFNILRRGEMFGEIAVLDGQPRTADAIALTDCSLLMLNRRDVVVFLEQNPQVALQFISVLCRTVRHTSERLESVMFLGVTARLARALRTFKDEKDEITLTQRELGQIIGSSRESVNQKLKAWETQNWVRLEKGRILIVDVAALDRLRNESD